MNKFDIIVIGGGHAGVESALASARLGKKVGIFTVNVDNISFMACNPSIGGTAKGHLVREIDALGGEMGINADLTMMQIKMLNMGKGAAVQSLRAQSDKDKFHQRMKSVLFDNPLITVIQQEVVKINEKNGVFESVETNYGFTFSGKAVVIASGVYLKSRTITGDVTREEGPSGFSSCSKLSKSLEDLGFTLKRFKTGTPARVKRSTIDFSKFEIQNGDENILPFSFLHDFKLKNQTPCYLGYTNSKTHQIILDNLSKSPLYCGVIKGVGPRYCPSIEDKVVRFRDKERHQIFLEPENSSLEEIYVQGMSSSMPAEIQIEMYRSISGFENVEIVRFAYAIEYDAVESLDLSPSLQFKKVKGVFSAGQINGSSGYEEAACQGLVAGINASRFCDGLSLVTFNREESYIGVLIDDLVTKGTNEPYRMMTARAERRLSLRQDNADERLTPLGKEIGLATPERLERYENVQKEVEKGMLELEKGINHESAKALLERVGEDMILNGSTLKNLLKRPKIKIEDITALGHLQDLSQLSLAKIETKVKYEGYLKKEEQEIAKAKKMEEKKIPDGIDYHKILGLRIEARQKLDKVKPETLGQASRISGVSPADISVLILFLSMKH